MRRPTPKKLAFITVVLHYAKRITASHSQHLIQVLYVLCMLLTLVDLFASCRRIVFCSGKVFYELHAEREKRGLDKDNTVALVRLEQVSCKKKNA